ncbi:MAG: response regulator [Deltaproteobacteria bacterium]|jgi:CheY-like chemotaxis protein|nr:response regulator [Deltaproteobacteria bacterium]MBW2533667.1 response regulator [Deltaproteobacteria bacterium]
MSSDNPLILFVADERAVSDETLTLLIEGGWPVQRCTHGREALQLAVVGDPGAVIANVDLPDMDGYELQAAYADAFAHRQTPFVLLTDDDAPQEVIPALAEGALGYLLRPVSAELLQATLTRITAEGSEATCEAAGALGERSLSEVFDYCRAGRLTGEIEVQSPAVEAILDFAGGELVTEGYDLSDEDMQELSELRAGTFAIRAREPGEHEVPDAAPEEGLAQPEPLPASRVTAVAVGDHMVNVETDFEPGDSEQISTVVSVDGKVRKRTTSVPPPRADRDTLEHYIADQHAAVEAGVRGKVEALLAKKHKRADPTDRELDRFVWLVRHACAKQDFAGASEILSGALAMFPHDSTLRGYRQLAQRKLGGS